MSDTQQRALRPIGLSPSAFRLLGELAAAPGGSLEPHALAERLAVTRPTVCGLVDGLERTGLVTRAPHEHDRRRVLVRLGDDGRRLVRTHRVGYDVALDSAVQDLSGAERGQLVSPLRRVRAAGAPGPR